MLIALALIVVPIAAERPPWRADATVHAGGAEDGNDDVQGLHVALGRRITGWTGVVGLQAQRRFGEQDQAGELWVYTPGRSRGYAWAMAGLAPGADVLARQAAEVGAEQGWDNGTTLTLRAVARWWPGRRVALPVAQLRQDLGSGLAVGAGVGLAWDGARRPTATCRLLVWREADAWDAGLTALAGIEDSPPDPATRVIGLSARVRWRLDATRALSADIAGDRRDDRPDRGSLALTATVRW
jgi:YaiO family outer membrane protein